MYVLVCFPETFVLSLIFPDSYPDIYTSKEPTLWESNPVVHRVISPTLVFRTIHPGSPTEPDVVDTGHSAQLLYSI